MKILRVIHSMNPVTGGPCQGIRNLVPDLRSLGCDNEVVCLDDPNASFLGSDPFPVHALGRGKWPLRYHAGLVPWLSANIGRFDAVIVHGLWLWPSIATWIAITARSRKSRRIFHPSIGSLSDSLTPCSQLPARNTPPYFMMPHGMLDPWFQSDRGRGWKRFRNLLFWNLVQKRVVNEASALLFTSRLELLNARDAFRGYRPKCEINVGYGIPVPPLPGVLMDDSFMERCPLIEKGGPYLLFLGRIHPKKGVDLLIRAYARLVGDRPPEKVHVPASARRLIIPSLVIAGPLETAHAVKMIGLAQSLLPGAVFTPGDHDSVGLTPASASSSAKVGGPAIHFTGMLDGNSKWGAIHGCDAFILPSHQENFGIAVVEAMGCGKPVLISDRINISGEIVESGGGISDADTEEGCLQLMKIWMGMSERSKKAMGSAARSAFSARYGSRPAAENLLEAIREQRIHP